MKIERKKFENVNRLLNSLYLHMTIRYYVPVTS